MKRIVPLGIVLIASLGAFYLYHTHNFTYREKLTVTFDTPDGVVEASGVIERKAWESYITLGEMGGRYWDSTGEAVVVNLAPESYLFVLRRYPRMVEVMATLGMVRGIIELENQTEIRSQVTPISLPPNRMPTMVMFTDINEPSSITVVDPDELTRVYGEGYALTGMTMQVTDEPVTGGSVEALLPWLEARGREHSNIKGKPMSGNISEQANAEDYRITTRDFMTELYK